MNKNILVGMAVTLIIGGVLGYSAAGYQYAAQLSKAKAAFPTQSSMTSVFGTIQSISGNTITMQSQASMNPFETLPTVRTVTVTSDTKIVKNAQKDPQTFQQEMLAYQKAIQKSTSTSSTSTPTSVGQPITPPMPFAETTVNIADLKVGDMISVDAGKEVKTAASFDAVKIIVTDWRAAAALIPTSATSTKGTAPIVNTPPPLKK